MSDRALQPGPSPAHDLTVDGSLAQLMQPEVNRVRSFVPPEVRMTGT